MDNKKAISNINLLIEDFTKLQNAEWVPDDESCNASIESLEAIREYIRTEKFDDRSIRDRLRKKGVTVTDQRNMIGKRMLINEVGEELGYFQPLEALEKFKA